MRTLVEKDSFDFCKYTTNMSVASRPNGEVVMGDVEHDGRTILYVIKGAGPQSTSHVV